MAQVRLQRFLSMAGVAARRKAEKLISAGQVTVNGEIVTELGTKVDADNDRVAVDGKAVTPQDFFYIVFNKPKGCLSAVSDPEGRRTVMEYLIGTPVAVAPVGRLDFNSEGVLLLTNDGDLSAALQSPKNHVEKTYHVKLRGKLDERDLQKLRDGVSIGRGSKTRPAEAHRLKTPSKHDWLVITLTEGKSRQLHRMAEAIGHQVTKIQRVAFAGITFHGLRVGDAREMTQAEVTDLRDLVELPRSDLAAARGKWQVVRESSERGRRAQQRKRRESDSAARPAAPKRARPTSAASKRTAAPKRARPTSAASKRTAAPKRARPTSAASKRTAAPKRARPTSAASKRTAAPKSKRGAKPNTRRPTKPQKKRR